MAFCIFSRASLVIHGFKTVGFQNPLNVSLGKIGLGCIAADCTPELLLTSGAQILHEMTLCDFLVHFVILLSHINSGLQIYFGSD